jgi:hypothetical protein
MTKHITIPTVNGIYWYFVPPLEPQAVSVNTEEFGGNRFKDFSGWKHSHVDKGSYFIGPIVPPKA